MLIGDIIFSHVDLKEDWNAWTSNIALSGALCFRITLVALLICKTFFLRYWSL
jgi:hypothetical protein